MTPVDPERWRQLQPILDEVLELSAEERKSRLEAICGENPALRADLEALLRADAATGGVLDEATGQLVESALRELQPERTFEERLLPGARVAGRYRIVSLLGRGGMGEVYRADDLKLGQAVALKFLPTPLQRKPEYLERLLGEAKLARQVSHPNVCRVYDIGEWENRQFLSMEYIDGEDLASLVRRIGHLPRQKALDIARQLCAGLDAAHQLGILHRDLKPANVMLDGNGRVRITDFGLAVAASQLEGREVRSGTPGYMAPEQLDGREATRRSDVYALGLVLYELFTGQRAFQASTIEALRRLQEESSPTRPSALVEGFDAAVERAILRCLEKDPALRPASARDVAALLPGGDPLAAAIAAGETPPPELVAASGPEGALSPRVAYAAFGAIVVMLVVLVQLSDRSSIVGWLSWPRTADALEDHARGILTRLGYDAPPVDRARLLWIPAGAYVEYVRTRNRSPERWSVLREPGQRIAVFGYRQAPDYLVPLGRHGWIDDIDPPLRAGDMGVLTDLRGRLLFFLARPADVEPPMTSIPAPDWSGVFEEAGLDMAGFHPVEPTRNPPVLADARAAWAGVLSDFGGHPVRVEAAAHRGTPVFFELVFPWDPYWDVATTSRGTASPGPTPSIVVNVLFLAFVLVVTGVLAVRNWLGGRGDRRGALRLAATVFWLRFSIWILGGHHVPALGQEWRLFTVAAGTSLVAAAATWCLYLALEPHARRLHPRLLVSWARLLRGRIRDPLVGRDVLLGVAFSILVILFWGQLYVVIPHALDQSAPPGPLPYPMVLPHLYLLDAPPARTLLGGRHVLEAFPAQALGAFAATLVFVIGLLGLRFLLRSMWAAVLVYLALGAALAWPAQFSEYSASGIACAMLGTAALIWALRIGLLSMLVLWFCVSLWLNFPVTAQLDAPHFSTGLVAVLMIAGLALYGAVITSRPPAIRIP
jgi:predicted Ser/Thr protein kinase